MKKIKISLVFLFFLITFGKNVYGISDNFKYVIDTIGIPRYNVYGQEINEDVYYVYNVFCYSSPLEASTGAAQGFAEVSGGKWTRENNKYVGNGIAGEYYYLGREYSGGLVSNVYYPVSFFPDTTPEYWNYVVVNGAPASWDDRSKYKYIEQLEYMKNTNILYDTLDFINRKTNPYKLIKYNITANQIGLDKIMLDTCSTWKTRGIMNVIRRDVSGNIRYSIFAADPIAASAEVKSDLKVENSYKISENDIDKKINIQYGASAINLTDYAKPKHIKNISASLYINGRMVSNIESSKVTSITKNYIYTLKREDASLYPLYIEVKSTMYTEFAVDGLMEDGLSKYVDVVIEKYKNKLESADIKEISKTEGKIYVSDLIKTDVTEKAKSCGIIECGRHMCLKLETDYQKEDISIYLNNNKINFIELLSKDGCKYLQIDIPNNYITVQSWTYLRNKYKDYFKVKQSDLGVRISNPNKLTIKIRDRKKDILFDTIDSFNMNFNYSIYNANNKEEINRKIEIKNW